MSCYAAVAERAMGFALYDHVVGKKRVVWLLSVVIMALALALALVVAAFMMTTTTTTKIWSICQSRVLLREVVVDEISGKGRFDVITRGQKDVEWMM